MAEEKKEERKKKKIKRSVPRAIVHINATFNNTIITVSDPDGMAIAWASGGSAGFKGTRKGTPFAAQKACEGVMEKAKRSGVREVDVKIKGAGPGRETAIRTIQSQGILILSIEDRSPIPHNGCRPRKKRSV